MARTHVPRTPVWGDRGLILGLLALLLAMLLFLMTGTPGRSAPIFTGNVPLDFTAADVAIFPDVGYHDVGLPELYPPGTISGWDVRDIYFDYDVATDILYVGIDCYGICGDADGDGDPGHTGPILAGFGGVDHPDLAETESLSLLLDTDHDWNAQTGAGDFEVVVGVPGASGSTVADFGIYRFVGTPYDIAFGYGEPLPNATSYYASPNASAPDFEFSIAEFSTLPDLIPYTFQIRLFAGSLEDDGIGEDYLNGFVPLGAPLESFEAMAIEGQVHVAWQTAMEVDLLGFNLYRNTIAALPTTPLNSTLIPSQSPGGGQGASYEWVDGTVTAGTTYFYWVESVAGSGNPLITGPVSVDVPLTTAVSLSGLAAAPSALPRGMLMGGLALLATLALLRVRQHPLRVYTAPRQGE